MGAELEARQWGLGGSQIIETVKVSLGRDGIVVEAETYVGLSISGAPRVVVRAPEIRTRDQNPRSEPRGQNTNQAPTTLGSSPSSSQGLSTR